jgi:hypothetical protein
MVMVLRSPPRVPIDLPPHNRVASIDGTFSIRALSVELLCTPHKKRWVGVQNSAAYFKLADQSRSECPSVTVK